MNATGEYEAVVGEASQAYGGKRRSSSDSCGNPRHRVSWLLITTSVIAQAFPLLLIGLIFTGSAWLGWALQRERNLTHSDWDRLYQLVGRKVLQPRNWFIMSLVLTWCLLELALMAYTGYMISHNRVLYRSHGRAYIMVHILGALLKIYVLAYVVDGGVRVITEHINGPENFLKGWQ